MGRIACPRGIPQLNLDTTRFAHMILFRNKQSCDTIRTPKVPQHPPCKTIPAIVASDIPQAPSENDIVQKSVDRE